MPRVDLYTDGGLTGSNPSQIAGSWAWVRVDDGVKTAEQCGWLRADCMPDGRITSNQSEFYAVLKAFEALKDGEIVHVYLDSEVTYKRWSQSAGRHGISDEWYHQMGAELRRCGGSFWHLIAGHPSLEDLARVPPSKKDGTPVSAWNVRADQLTRFAGALAGLVLLSERYTEDEFSYILADIGTGGNRAKAQQWTGTGSRGRGRATSGRARGA